MSDTLWTEPEVPAPPGDDLGYYFRTTVEYLRSQPGRAVMGNTGACTYTAPDGNRCAVGLWIPERHAARTAGGGVHLLFKSYPNLAGVAWPVAGDQDPSWDGLFYDSAIETRGIDSGLRLACELQRLHDEAAYRVHGNGLNEEGEIEVRRIAEKYGLDYPEPDHG